MSFVKAHKRKVLLISVVGTVVLLAVLLAKLPDAFDRHMKKLHVSPERVYQLSEQLMHLPEELAIAKALVTLEQEGYDTNVSLLVPDGRSSAPDGERDVYFVRNNANPSHGSFTAQNAAVTRRFVHVSLEGETITTCVVIPK